MGWLSEFREKGITSLEEAILFAKKMCMKHVCRESSDVEHRVELKAGFIIESPDERDGISIDIRRCDYVSGTKLHDIMCLSITLTWVRSSPDPSVIGVSPILMIPLKDIMDVLVVKEGEVSMMLKPCDYGWNVTVHGRKAEVSIETFMEYPPTPDYPEELLEEINFIRITIR